MSQKAVTGKPPYRTPSVSKRMLVKSNQINEAVFQLTSTEYRLILILISQIQENDTETTLKYSFSTLYMANLLGMGKNKDAYARIRDAVQELHTKTVLIKVDTAEIRHNWLISSFYSRANGNFTLELNPNLKPYLLNLKGRFTKYRLSYVLNLPTLTSIRLYELLKQYVNAGGRSFDSIALRLQLGLHATDYKKSYDFKAKVLTPAMREINEKTDIQIEMQELKDGRRIGGYKFMVKNKEVAVSPPSLKNDRLLSRELTEQLQQIGFTPRQLHLLSGKYTEKFIREHLELALEKHNKEPYKDLVKHLGIRWREAHAKNKPTTKNVVEISEIEEKQDALEQSLAKKSQEAQALAVNVELEDGVESLSEADRQAIEGLSGEPMQQIVTPNYQSSTPPKPMPTEEPIIEVHDVKPKKQLRTLSAELYNELVAFGVTSAQLKNLAFTYDEERIKNNLEYTKERHAKKPLDAPVRYLYVAIEQNYYEAQLNDLQGARGLLRGNVVSHLPRVPNPVQPIDLPYVEIDGFPNTTSSDALQVLTNIDDNIRNHALDHETINFLLQYRIDIGFVQSKDELEALMFEYFPQIAESISNGNSLEEISAMEKELVDFYLDNKR